MKLLVLAGAVLESKNKDGMRPIDFVPQDSQTWRVLHDSGQGIMPKLEETVDILTIPEYSLLVIILLG